MRNNYRRVCTLLATTALATAAQAQESTTATAATATSSAQTTAPAKADAGLEEIVVTARKRPESLISVPVAVTALSSADIQRYNTNDLSQITRLAPQLIIARSQALAGASFSIRGIGSSPDDAGIDSSVAVVLDGVPISRGRIITQAIFDLSQIEVLKGPQALFFGKNSPAGVVSLKSIDPTDRLEGSVQAGYEFRQDARYIQAAIGGPVTDSLKMRLVLYGLESAGYMRNVSAPGPNPFFGPTNPSPGAPSGRQPNDRSLSGRFTAIYNAGKTFDATLKVLLGKDRQNSDNGATEVICRPGVVTGSYGVPDPTGDCKLDLTRSVSSLPPAVGKTVFGANNGVPFSHTDLAVTSLTMNYHPGKFTVTSVTGYSYLDYKGFDNMDWTSYAQVYSAEQERNKVFSQELRANTDLDGPLNFGIGGYYEHYNRRLHTAAGFLPIPDPVTGRYDAEENLADLAGETLSAFAQARWKILPNLELDGGARFTHETKTTNNRNTYVNAIVTSLLPSPFLPVGTILKGDYSQNNVSPEVTLSWHPTPTQTIYAAYKQGFKSGGFANPAILTSKFSDPSTISLKNESAKGGEVGYKAELFGHKLRIEADAYYYEYTNLQLAAYIPVTNAFNVSNAGKAKVKGVEASVDWRVARPFTLRGALAYNHARFSQFDIAQCFVGEPTSSTLHQSGTCFVSPLDAAGKPVDPVHDRTQDLAGRPLVRAPDWVGNIGGTYDTAINAKMMIAFDADVRYSDSYYTDQSEDPTIRQKSYTLLNASVRLHQSDDKWQLALIGKNLTNELYFSQAGQKPAQTPGGAAGAYFVSVELPRTIEIQGTIHF